MNKSLDFKTFDFELKSKTKIVYVIILTASSTVSLTDWAGHRKFCTRALFSKGTPCEMIYILECLNVVKSYLEMTGMIRRISTEIYFTANFQQEVTMFSYTRLKAKLRFKPCMVKLVRSEIIVVSHHIFFSRVKTLQASLPFPSVFLCRFNTLEAKRPDRGISQN